MADLEEPLSEQLDLRVALPAPVSRAWSALTGPRELEAWFWPPKFATAAGVDLRVGGRYSIASSVAGIAVGGHYLTVRPADRLVFTWEWDGESGETVVTAELAEDAVRDGAELHLIHSGFATAADRDNHITGWNDCLNRLATWLAAPSPGGGGG